MTSAHRAPHAARPAARPAAAHSPRRRASIGSAAEDFDAEAFAQLYSKLAATLSASQTVGGATDLLLSVLIPGQYVEQNLDPKAPSTQYLLANVLNPTLECSWVTRRNAATVPDVYESIINGKETPLVRLSPEQKAELDRAARLLYQADGAPTPYYAEYLADSLDYLTALDAYEQADATQANGGPPVPPEIVAALEAADARWRDHGHKADVDRALATIAELEAFEPAAYWHQLAVRYRDSTRGFDDSRYQHTAGNPPYPRWFDDDGWTSFEFDEQDFVHQDRSGSVGVGDGCRCPDGVRPGYLWRVPQRGDRFRQRRVTAVRPRAEAGSRSPRASAGSRSCGPGSTRWCCAAAPGAGHRPAPATAWSCAAAATWPGR